MHNEALQYLPNNCQPIQAEIKSTSPIYESFEFHTQETFDFTLQSSSLKNLAVKSNKFLLHLNYNRLLQNKNSNYIIQ